ncbi:MAG: hypothetical protein ACQCN5_00670 [Candidatus Bathyarchaeia archaeon]
MESESINITDRQATDICENVGQTLIGQLDNQNVWNNVEAELADFLKSKNINLNASDLIDRLDWSVRVTLKK